MTSTLEWAQSHNESVTENPPSLEISPHFYPRTAREVATRAVILEGLVAVAYMVDPEMIIKWFQEQDIWNAVTPREKEFLLAVSRTEKQCIPFQCHQEAEWALLWMIGRVEALGLPTHFCDTRQLVDEIIPGLLTDIEPFLNSAELRDPNILLAEDFRTYNLWCYAVRDRRLKTPLPHDLKWTVLYERRYAFEWLDSMDSWDNITCDA